MGDNMRLTTTKGKGVKEVFGVKRCQGIEVFPELEVSDSASGAIWEWYGGHRIFLVSLYSRRDISVFELHPSCDVEGSRKPTLQEVKAAILDKMQANLDAARAALS